MEKTEFTSRKFQICFSATKEDVLIWEESNSDEISTKLSMNLSEFRKLLIKNDLDEYLNLLLGYISSERYQGNQMRIWNNKSSKYKLAHRDELDYMKELAETYRYLIDSTNGTINSLKIIKNRDNPQEIRNETLLCSIINSLTNWIEIEFRNKNGHMDSLTMEEAREQVLAEQDKSWINVWNNQYKYTDAKGGHLQSISLDSSEVEYWDVEEERIVSAHCVKDRLLEEYAISHEVARDIDIPYLDGVISRCTEQSRRRGAPEKHNRAKNLMSMLTNLIWTELFFKNDIKSPDPKLFRTTNNMTIRYIVPIDYLY